MNIYRVSIVGGETSGVEGEHQGYSYHSSKADAQRAVREVKANGHECTIEVTECKPTKAEIIDYLNRYAAHPNNG